MLWMPPRDGAPRRRGSKLALPLVALAASLLVASCAAQPSAPRGKVTFSGPVHLGHSGMPNSPQPWHPTDFAIVKHLRNAANGPVPFDGGTAMAEDHGADCSAPPATHQTNGNYNDMMYVCHEHVMTAINSDNNGYGELMFQPNVLVDWSHGPATVTINMSTFRTSDRDWVGFLFVPFNEQLTIPVNYGLPDGQGLPRDSVQVEINNSEEFSFEAKEWVNWDDTRVDAGPTLQSAIPSFKPSKTTRIPAQITISRTHLKMTFPSLGFTELNADFPTPLTFTQAVFQVIHHSYTPTKGVCDSVPAEQEALGKCLEPDTWHWSNLAISSAVPYTLINGAPDAVGDDRGVGNTVQFPAPAPAGSYLRFQVYADSTANGDSSADYSISFDGGKTWQPIKKQVTDPSSTIWNVTANIWQPIPAGTTKVLLKAKGDNWYARDFTIMSLAAPGGASAAQPRPIQFVLD